MKQTQKKRILIVEVDAHIAEGLKRDLSLQGYEAAIAGTHRGTPDVERVESAPDRARHHVALASTAVRSPFAIYGWRTNGSPS